MATELARNLGPEELITKGICPVKKEYLKPVSEVKKRLVEVVVGTAEAAGGQGPIVQKKGKKKQKQVCIYSTAL